MKFYLAPLEGITGHIYRNALEKYFPGTDRYFTPFIAPDQNKVLRTKERRDVLPENNHVKELVPQILTNHAEHFCITAQMLQEMGYDEVNLNLGCPSGTVAARKRGSGFLAYPEELDRFLEQIFEGSSLKISIKTRIGRDDGEQLHRLMEIYRQYPLSELIVHPRTQKEFYRAVPRQELFERFRACEEVWSGTDDPEEAGQSERMQTDCVPDGGRMQLCYNGNLLTREDYQSFTQSFPQITAVMLGRGVIANPGLIRQLRTGQPTDLQTLGAFHEEVLEGYRTVFGEDKNAMFRMKELWIYMIHLFADAGKYCKKIHKAQSLAQYRCAVDQLFQEGTLLPEGPEHWNLPQR